ncbi:NERD domain-containing protein [Lysinibacillus sp. 54212]|uniref:NERD domain-containing protein n=1 Tax=Lysinibacillus sp. 54212 TaxID=3119829 RepID=UPI002FCC77AA
MTLSKRLHPEHEKYPQIQDEIKRIEAGDFGERYLIELFETELNQDMLLLHNIFIGKNQIDLLLLTKNWCLLLEVKNIKGHLIFTTNPRQLIRRNEDGTEEVFQSPESQLERLHFALDAFFKKHAVNLPIYSAIIFPFNNVIIEKSTTQFPVFVGKDILNYIKSFKVDKNYSNIAALSKLLQNISTPWHRFPLCDYYNIPPYFIRIGVECTHCGTIPMIRLNRTWKCGSCGVTDRHAHVKALQDYYVLIGNYITSRDALNYLGLRNRFEAIRILNSTSIRRIGHTKSSKYELKL